MPRQPPNKPRCDSDPRGALFRATTCGDETVVKALLACPDPAHDQLNHIGDYGWTPLIVACHRGLTSIAQLLLAAGANQDIVDWEGWVAKEHAVFEGHLSLVELFAPHSGGPSARMGPSQLRYWGDYEEHCSRSQIFVYLGPSHTRSKLAPIQLNLEHLRRSSDAGGLQVDIRSQGTSIDSTIQSTRLPIPNEPRVNSPYTFTTEDPDKVILVFTVRPYRTGTPVMPRPHGTATVLLKSLREGFAPARESLTRHHTLPLIHPSSMRYIGTITFSVLVITPFASGKPLPKASPGFWQRNGPYPVVDHRYSRANSTARTGFDLGENTYQSVLKASKRGASSMKFVVQLTKDYHPVIYHDFFVKETGGDVSLSGLSLDEFQHLSLSQAPKSDRSISAEQRYIENAHQEGEPRPKPRRHSLNQYDHFRSHHVLEHVRHTENGHQGNFKGNLWGCAIQEPSTTLERLLTSLPEHIAFDLEIKYPMLWEAEDRAMDHTVIELNTYVDKILSTIFCHCGHRNITLTSFSPEVCIALACKQYSFPILMITNAGTVPAGDVRARSLAGALEFAMTWDLDGLVVKSDPLVMCPRLVEYMKSTGVVVVSYGDLNSRPESVLIQVNAGLEAVITDKAHLISKSLAHIPC